MSTVRMSSKPAAITAIALALSLPLLVQQSTRTSFADELKPGSVFRDCPQLCPAMVVLPAGRFTMGLTKPEIFAGDPDREMIAQWQLPQHKVQIAKPFAVGQYEITISEWTACFKDGACNGPPSITNAVIKKQPPEKTAIYDISWIDAVNYAGWLSKKTGQAYRLLTEAEWEYAARAGSTTLYPWGDDVGQGNVACSTCGAFTPPPVIGAFKPNSFGLYDTVGGVPEWVQDCFHADYKGAPHDGSAFAGGDCSQRVIRSHMSGANPLFLVTSIRMATNSGNAFYGLRVARDLK